MITTSILVTKKQQFEKFVEKMNKKAVRFGCEQIQFSYGGTFLHENEESGEDYLFIEVFIEESTINIPGYTIAGVVEKVGSSVLIHTSDDKYLGMFRNASTSLCHHCGVNRERNKVIILQGENEILQVGTSCLKDFTGQKSAVQYADMISTFFNREIMEEFQNGGTPSFPVEEIIAATVKIIKSIGFVSRAMAEEKFCLSTADELREVFFNKKKKNIDLSESDFQKAKEIIEWVHTLEDTTNNFLFNLFQLVNVGYVSSKHFGFLAAAIPAFNRAMESKQEKIVSQFVGTVGEKKVQFTGKCVKIIFIDTRFGLMKKYIFNVGGNVIVYSTNLNFCNEGEEVSFTGTIKNHIVYKDVNQTEVTRCKLI